MRIDTIRIENFRCFEDTTIPINKFTAFVGANGAGKSTVLCALNVFFKETTSSAIDVINLVQDDFHNRNDKEPIRITVHFAELGEVAKEDFKGYFRSDKLIITCEAILVEGASSATTKHYGQRLVFEAFVDFFKALNDGARVDELRVFYNSLRDKYGLAKETTKDRMTAALRAYEEERTTECVLKPSEDHFYGATKGAGKLNKHVQWVYVPAVKDATSEEVETRAGSLGKLLARQVRTKVNFGDEVAELRADLTSRYTQMLTASQSALDSLSKSLEARLIEFSHPEAKLNLQWRDDEKSVRIDEPLAHVLAGEGDFMGGLGRFGHGLQRSYLLALLHELASNIDSEIAEPTLLLGCEEPELYQHPPQARHLGGVMRKISLGNAQVLISTHSPHFVSGDSFDDVRLVRRHPKLKCSRVAYVTHDDLAADIETCTGEAHLKVQGVKARVHQALQPAMNEMFFSTKLILVEGLEDVAYLSSAIALQGRYEEFRRQGCHIVAANGKSALLQALVIAKRLCIPTYVVFDADGDKEDRGGSRAKHEKDNRALLKFVGFGDGSPFPSTTLWEPGICMWDSDIGTVAAREVGTDKWQHFSAVADAECGHVKDAKKHTLHIGSVLTSAWDAGLAPPSLIKLCEAVISSVLPS